jgi:hypothetical protein
MPVTFGGLVALMGHRVPSANELYFGKFGRSGWWMNRVIGWPWSVAPQRRSCWERQLAGMMFFARTNHSEESALEAAMQRMEKLMPGRILMGNLPARN